MIDGRMDAGRISWRESVGVKDLKLNGGVNISEALLLTWLYHHFLSECLSLSHLF